MLDRRISVAPMMDCTDRHDRFFLRLISPHVLLYSEMITAQAILYGDQKKLLGFHRAEHPIALQLGGSDATMLKKAAQIGEDFGYDEINLNVGCPSPRVKSGRFGACLMLEPNLVAECVSEMQNTVKIPVTVKCRIGVDEVDTYTSLCEFIEKISQSGCRVFIIHARKAWLNGLSPKQNREIPPLNYERVYQIKKDFPLLTIIINGGIKYASEVKQHLTAVDGVMIGREAYSNPYLLAELEREIFQTNKTILSREQVVHQLIPYVKTELLNQTKLTNITRHITGLFHGQPGARVWRRYLSENAYTSNDAELLLDALASMQNASC